MIPKKEAETDPVSPAKPEIDKPVRARKTKVVEPEVEPAEIIAPVIEEIITETIEISSIDLEDNDDSDVSNQKKSKNKIKTKVKMKDKDKKKAKKADAKEKAKQKAKAKKAKKNKKNKK
jgi:hypothetical protein